MISLALDVALGAEDAVTHAPPRLHERLSAAWHALSSALSHGRTAVAAPQLAFLARHRLVGLPPDAGRAQQLVRLVGTAQLTDPALLLLARWAHHVALNAGQATQLLHELATAALDAYAAGVATAGPTALLLAAASLNRESAPAVHERTWNSAVDIIERRRHDIWCVDTIYCLLCCT